jgi:hypothetical protein
MGSLGNVEHLVARPMDLEIVLRRYGFLGLDRRSGCEPIDSSFEIVSGGHPAAADGEWAGLRMYLVSPGCPGPVPGLDCRVEAPGGLLLEATARGWFQRRRVVYKPLFKYVTFSGPGVVPVWTTESGRAVIAWLRRGGRQDLLVGLCLVEELVGYNQGDPAQVERCSNKACWGFPQERPAYLYENQIHADYPLMPWADNLGFTVVELLAEGTGLPLLAPLPYGAKGAVLLTGDDDQAYLEKYDEQVRMVGDFPITYLLLPHTRHTRETLKRFPANVQLGVHIDALPEPERYDEICAEQSRAVDKLIGRHVEVVRNHGHLSRGYEGHLAAWEACELGLDLNLPGMDGTARTASYLPFRVRRLDGTWSRHLSLFSAFSDSMRYQLKWSERKQRRRILALARQVEATRPGVLVFNYHPQNIGHTRLVHRAILKLGRKRGWIALGAESYLTWLRSVESLQLSRHNGKFVLESPQRMEGLALRYCSDSGWSTQVLPPWTGKCVVG